VSDYILNENIENYPKFIYIQRSQMRHIPEVALMYLSY